MEAQIEKKATIRLKVTEKCPWDCRFCHKEGGWGIDDISWNDSTRSAFESLQKELKINEVHFTGGEPTHHKELPVLTSGLVSLGIGVKTTTNGQFGEATLKRLMQSGLRHFNFSVLSMKPDEFVKSQRKRNPDWARRCLERQRAIIFKAAEMGANVKINTVVSSKADTERALGVYQFARANNLLIRFLNDLGNGREAVDAIDDMVVNGLGAKKLGTKAVLGSSSVTTYYDDRGYTFGVKGIRPYRLRSLCNGCREICTEGFYGIRMEQRKGTFFVRLCLNRDDESSVMSLDVFLASKQFREIQRIFC